MISGISDAREEIYLLIAKAAKAVKSDDAMRFSQAAVERSECFMCFKSCA